MVMGKCMDSACSIYVMIQEYLIKFLYLRLGRTLCGWTGGKY